MQTTNLLWGGLAVVAAKRYDRDLLLPGDYPLRFKITGQTGGDKLSETISGSLRVAENQSRSSSKKPDAEALVASLLYQMTPAKRRAAVAAIAEEGIEDPDPDCVITAKHLIQRLTTQNVSTVRGSVAFELS